VRIYETAEVILLHRLAEPDQTVR